MKNLKETLNDDFNYSVTENGALGYRTSGKELLDLNFSVSSMRNMSEEKIVEKFVKAFYEDKILAMKWLFYCRDCREGIGERRLFRTCMKYLAENHQDIAKEVIKLVPEYGRWDDLWCLLDTDLKDDVCEVVVHQLLEDGVNMKQSKPISLKENEAGVALVSGFSPAIVKMVLSNSTDPFECLLEQLNSERYTPVENAVKDLVA